jgi:glycosyltransferase involved in cell wall biosynthesis
MKAELGINGGLVLMYVGNLEAYQGIDLLLESFALVLEKTDRASDIQKYQKKSQELGIDGKVHFLGPKPVEFLLEYLSEADILVSSRTSGNNTPMKLYSYLHSGKAVLATNLPTHTQVLHRGVAVLVEPVPKAFSEAMLCLIEDEDLRKALGVAGKRLIEERFTYTAFREKLSGFFDWMEGEIRGGPQS